MAVMFGGKSTDSHDSLRYKLFSNKIVSPKSFVSPERLAPTESSTKYHSLRVYYQVMVWIETAIDMNVLDWGWKQDGNQFMPVMSNKTAAPEILLKMVHCYCNTACRKSQCSCKGLWTWTGL